MKKKKTGLRPLVTRLDRAFSRYIRMKAADENGLCECVTCGARKHYKQMHCGHFIKRQHMSVRFDEVNCGAQCVKCNLYNGGCQDMYATYILKTHGEKVLLDLMDKKKEVKKWTRAELEDLIDKYEALAAREAERLV